MCPNSCALLIWLEMTQIVIKMIFGWIIVHECDIISHFRSIISSIWSVWHHFNHVEVGRSSASARNFLIDPMSFLFIPVAPWACPLLLYFAVATLDIALDGYFENYIPVLGIYTIWWDGIPKYGDFKDVQSRISVCTFMALASLILIPSDI